MLRRTKSKLIECGNLVLPPLTEITVYVFYLHFYLAYRFFNDFPILFVYLKDIYLDRMAPLVSLQKKVYLSILRKELPKLLAFSSGASNHQSLQNIV